MYVHETLHPFYTTKKMAYVTATVTNIVLLFTQYKTMGLTAISSHCLAALPAKDVCVQQAHAEGVCADLKGLALFFSGFQRMIKILKKGRNCENWTMQYLDV